MLLFVAVKVLILHQHFKTPFTGGALRSFYLAGALVQRGHEVTVIAAHGQPKKTEDIEGIHIHWLPVSYKNKFGFVRRVYSFLIFNRRALRLVPSLGQFDICYAMSTPLTIGLAALRIKAKYGIPYVFEIGDLWPDAPIQLGFIKSAWLKRRLYNLETKIYRSALTLVALSEPMASLLHKKTPGKSIFVVPGMADTKFFRMETRPHSGFVISYFGVVGYANGLENLIEFAAAAQTKNLNVHFNLVGEGASLSSLMKKAASLDLANLSFIPFCDQTSVREIMKGTDAVYVGYRQEAILETGCPNKFLDGLAAGKLIIVNFGGWVKDAIEAHRCGVYLDAENPEDFVEKIKPFLEDPLSLSEYQHAARNLAESTYSREKIGSLFADAIEQISMLPSHKVEAES